MTSLEHMSDFALSLRRESNIEGSSVCSPLSIGLVLALLHAGANGATKTQIAHALAKGANDEDVQSILAMSMQLPASDGTTEVSIANRLYLRAELAIEQNYLAVIKKNFDALAQTVDFTNASEAAKVINDYVKAYTMGKIPGIIKAETITEDTAAILVNAIYFSANWKKPFSQTSTKTVDFFPGDGTKRKVQMMHQTDRFMYTETSEVQVLSIKYVDESYAYDVFLPKENFAGGLDAFLAGFTGTKMHTLLQAMRLDYVRLRIPKAKVETSLDLNVTLEKLGIKDVFNPKTADLSGISKDETKPLYVSRVVHKAFIEVHELGTTAGAATAARIGALGVPPEFNANRPYFFALTKDGAPLFSGVYR